MVAEPPSVPARKKLVRRRAADHSQRLRHGVQFLFLALNVWLGIEFLYGTHAAHKY